MLVASACSELSKGLVVCRKSILPSASWSAYPSSPHPIPTTDRRKPETERRLCYFPSFSKNKQIDSIPRWKFGIWNFSFGACRLSSGRPKPIITLGTFSTS